jgi:hypothetical protein
MGRVSEMPVAIKMKLMFYFSYFVGKVPHYAFVCISPVITERTSAADVNASLVFSYIHVQSGKYYSESINYGHKYWCV